MSISRFLPVLLVLAVVSAQSQTPTTDTIQGIINTYMRVVGVGGTCGDCVIGDTLGTGLEVGDRVVVMQMKGAMFNTTNNKYFGVIENPNAAGLFEFATVSSIVPDDDLELICFEQPTINMYNADPMLDAYRVGVQLIRVPQYQNVLVANSSDTLRPKMWDGETGGVLVFEASGAVTLEGTISAYAKGFGGGSHSGDNSDVDKYGYVYDANSQLSGYKGDGVGHVRRNGPNNPDLQLRGRGPSVNGGGGGNARNAGGGGGGNSGEGGIGGHQSNAPTGTIIFNGGLGGRKYSYGNEPLQRVWMGGGGGGGHKRNYGNPPDTSGGDGGRGGGIVIIRSSALTGNGNRIQANGEPGHYDQHSGAGGGGAGGVVLVSSPTFTDDPTLEVDLIIEAKGGEGGSAGGTACYAPGGGGGGGIIWFSVSKPTYISVNADGGAAGVIDTPESCTEFIPHYGATGGVNGEIRSQMQLPGDAP